jgi:hypothetical protein
MNETTLPAPQGSVRTSKRKLLLPIGLTALGAWVFAGCVYIPTFGPTVRGRNAAGDIGPPDSKKPIRVTASTLADVIRLLGEPPLATSDRRVVGYPWSVRNGYLVWPLCFSGESFYGHRTLVLRFDERQVLQSFEILKHDDDLQTAGGVLSMTPLPPEIARERAEEMRRQYELKRALSRPTAAPPVAEPE